MASQDEKFTLIAPNPFITGNPVPVEGGLFFGREDNFVRVEQKLLSESEGIVLLFVGERRSGRGIVKCCGWEESASGDFRLLFSFHRRRMGHPR